MNFGRWAGRTIAEISATEPESLAQWIADPDFDGHGGESRAALTERAGRWLCQCVKERGHTLAITNAPVLKAMIFEVLGAPADAFWRIDIAPLSLTDLRHDGRRWAMRSCGFPLLNKLG